MNRPEMCCPALPPLHVVRHSLCPPPLPHLQVMTLVMGRVFVLLGCSEVFARMALPVLMDGVVSGHSQQPAATYACLTKTMAGGWVGITHAQCLCSG